MHVMITTTCGPRLSSWERGAARQSFVAWTRRTEGAFCKKFHQLWSMRSEHVPTLRQLRRVSPCPFMILACPSSSDILVQPNRDDRFVDEISRHPFRLIMILSFFYYTTVLFGSTLGSLLFLDGPLINETRITPAMTSFIGPQASDHRPAIVGNIVAFSATANPCNLAGYTKEFNNVIVYLAESGPCSDEVTYDGFVSKGAIALIREIRGYVPGKGVNLRDNYGRRPGSHRNTVPFFEIQADERVFPAILNSKATRVSITMDEEVWSATFSSWYYQAGLRWIPGILFGFAAISASIYLYRHLTLLKLKYKRKYQQAVRSRERYWRYIINRLQIPHFALVLIILTSLTMSIVFCVGGWLSTSNLQAPIVRFFVTQLSGFSFLITMMSARVWVGLVADLTPKSSPSIMYRLIGTNRIIGFVIFTSVPFISDLVFSVMYSTYRSRLFPELEKLNGFVAALSQTIVGVLFLVSSISFQRTGYEIAKAHPSSNPKLLALLYRMSISAALLGITMMMYVLGTLFIALAPFFYQPYGWTVTWTIISIGHATSSIIHVQMFCPRDIDRAGTERG